VILAPGAGGRWITALSGFLVLVPAALGLGRIAELVPDGQLLLLFLLVLIAAADVGAYFGGRTFGRRKLAPRVSPNKTWEGFWSGVVAAGCAAAVGGWLLGAQPLPWLAVCLLVALVSVVGDLVESMFKRRAGLKDSSGLLPGHGGILDRLDSLSAAGPMFLLGLHVIGVPG
jgi:phosphatidate cytidylyltransferase